jgi:hypothetical protein
MDDLAVDTLRSNGSHVFAGPDGSASKAKPINLP